VVALVDEVLLPSLTRNRRHCPGCEGHSQ